MVPGRTPSSVSNEERIALALRDLDRDDLVGEAAVLDGRGGALVALGRELVLRLARDVADAV